MEILYQLSPNDVILLREDINDKTFIVQANENSIIELKSIAKQFEFSNCEVRTQSDRGVFIGTLPAID